MRSTESDQMPKLMRSLSQFQFALITGAVLFVSGVIHLLLIWVTGASWAGPLSLRKPALFGISAGLTTWSIAWTRTKLAPFRHDQLLTNLIASSFLAEVALITLQYWRGVPSHFHRATPHDAFIERTMLVLIVFVTAGIAHLTWQSRALPELASSTFLAIRAGLWLLLVSCGLGFLASVCGDLNIANGQSPEIWGRAGVLKYPHGATLHAIQTLPLLESILARLHVSRAMLFIRAAVASHILFLFHALWHTFHGRARMDFDRIGATAFVAAVALLTVPLGAILLASFSRLPQRWLPMK